MSDKAASTPFSEDALFRYHVVSLVRARLLAGEERAHVVADVASMDHPTARGGLRRVCTRTLYRWLARSDQGGAAALENRPRKRQAASRVLSDSLLKFVVKERGDDPDASIPELLRRAKEEGLLTSARDVDRTTVYRALVRMHVPTGRTKQERGRDMRRFRYAHRMEMVLADGKHFRAGSKRARRVAFFYLDNATRMGLNVVVGPSEGAALFLRGFHDILRNHGRMGILYLDHGPGFIANAVAEVCRRLEISLLHGERKYPQGHGMIEKFNQTAWNDLLRAFDGRPDVDPSPPALELRIGHWLRRIYNHEPHASLVRS